MRAYIIIILFVLCSNAVAESYVYLHTVSYHENRAAEYNEMNSGIGFRKYYGKKYLTAGFYHNSEYNQSVYVGTGYEWPVSIVKVGVSFGIISGYQAMPLTPYVIANIRYKRLNLIVSPFVEPVLHLTIDILKFN